MKKKLLIVSIILFILILSLVYLYNNKAQAVLKSLGLGEINEFNLEESVDYSEIGENAKVTSAIITKRTTGVGPFDEESETDSENSDGSIKWTAEYTMTDTEITVPGKQSF